MLVLIGLKNVDLLDNNGIPDYTQVKELSNDSRFKEIPFIEKILSNKLEEESFSFDIIKDNGCSFKTGVLFDEIKKLSLVVYVYSNKPSNTNLGYYEDLSINEFTQIYESFKRNITDDFIFTESEHLKNVYITERLILYFDVAGFVTKMNKIGDEQGVSIYRKIIKETFNYETLNRIMNSENLRTDTIDVNFLYGSDSFIVYSKPLLSENKKDYNSFLLQQLIIVARHLFKNFMNYGLPIQGCIGIGEFHVDRINNIFMGCGYIDAITFVEKIKQQWFGIIISKNLNKRINAKEFLSPKHTKGFLRNKMVQYDVKHRLYREETKYGGVTQGFKQYEYNQREIISDIKMLNASQVVTKHDHYEYDAQGQLELARKIVVGQSTEEHTYDFDLNGNRVFVKRPNEVKKVTILEPNSNRIDKIANESNGVLIDLTWDTQGRLKEKMDYENNKKYVFTFNELDKLTEIKVYDTSNVQLGAVLTEHLIYEYYSTGLMKKQQNVITTTNEFYIYDKHSNLIQVQDQSGHSDKTYIYAGSTRIGHTDNVGIVTLYINDHLGSKTGEYKNNGTITEEQEFSPFGLPKNPGEASYTGKFYSDKLEMYYFNARWYDPELGIFISEDPAVAYATDPLTLNTYAFVKNNPIMNIDPDGEFFFLALAAWAGFNVGAVAAIAATLDAAAWAGLKSSTINAGFQWAGNGFDASKINWNSVGNSFLSGGVANMTSGVINFGDGFVESTIAGGANAVLSDVALDWVQGRNINITQSYNDNFGYGAAGGALKWGYKQMVGYRPNMESGKGVLGKDGVPHRYPGEDAREGYNVIGNPVGKGQWSLTNDVFPGREGDPLSSALNFFPGFNSFAHLHDNWAINTGNINFDTVVNTLNMIPSYAYNVGSMYQEYRYYYNSGSMK